MACSSKPKLYSRYFNKLEDRGAYIEKCSILKEKLSHEYAFLLEPPEAIKEFYPQVHSFTDRSNQASYMIEKIETLDSSYLLIEKHLFSDLKIRNVVQHIFSYLQKVPRKKATKDDFMASVNREILRKNILRVSEIRRMPVAWELQELAAKNGFESIEHFLEELNREILEAFERESLKDFYFSHGDLCFSNIILFGEKLYLIDPKGAPTPEQNYRPVHYDLAKFSHSLLGRYDLINHELIDINNGVVSFSLKIPPATLAIKEFCDQLPAFGTSLRTIRLIEASFFLSMIPLHNDSQLKMKAFFLNSVAIFRKVL